MPTACALIAGLFLCAGAAAWFGRVLWLDGALYFLVMVANGDFMDFAWARRGAVLLTQVPLKLALDAGVSDIVWLARIYGTTLYAPAVLSYATTTWLTRRDAPLAIANAAVVLACFFPVSLYIIGEFQVLYALFWCSFILLITRKADGPVGSLVLLVLALLMVDSYEIAALFCPLLMLAVWWRIRRSANATGRLFLRLALIPLAVGTIIGAIGIMMPDDPGNRGSFLHALLASYRNITLVGLLGLVAIAGVACVLRWPLRPVVALLLAVVCAGFGWELGRLNGGPILGDVAEQRAQVVPIMFGIAILCGALAWWREEVGARPWQSEMWPLLFPVLLVCSLDLHDTLGWRAFVGRFCAVLAQGPAEDRAAFPNDPAARRYGCCWTYTPMSVLLRPSDSSAFVPNPPPKGFEPFDPDAWKPDLADYKAAGGLCRIMPVRLPGVVRVR